MNTEHGISARVRTVLAARNVSVKQAAEELGVKYRTLQNNLLGVNAPSAELLAAVCTRYEVNGHWLLTGKGEMFGTRPEVARRLYIEITKRMILAAVRMADSAIDRFHVENAKEERPKLVAQIYAALASRLFAAKLQTLDTEIEEDPDIRRDMADTIGVLEALWRSTPTAADVGLAPSGGGKPKGASEHS